MSKPRCLIPDVVLRLPPVFVFHACELRLVSAILSPVSLLLILQPSLLLLVLGQNLYARVTAGIQVDQFDKDYKNIININYLFGLLLLLLNLC